jgi:hypothetical protein
VSLGRFDPLDLSKHIIYTLLKFERLGRGFEGCE